MGIFGWSYPPGCSCTPFDGPDYCEVCENLVDDCICPECKVCEEVGNPSCYDEKSKHYHGMILNDEQKEAIENNKARYSEDEPPYYEEDWYGNIDEN